MRKTVLLLGHKARVGKDSLADHLVENHGYTRFGFADKLKDTVADLYGFSWDQMYGDAKSVQDSRYVKGDGSTNYTPREILQDFGQEQRKRFPDIWADYVKRQIEESEQERFVISDFRFPNEHKVMSRLDGSRFEIYAVRITRDGLPDFPGMYDISEKALDGYQDWNFTIHNGTRPLAEFLEYSKDLLTEYRIPL